MSSLLALQDAAAPSFFSLDPTQPMDVLGCWLICFLTLSVFSFLYKDNPFYKTAEHLFVGVGTAYFTLQYYDEGIMDPVVQYIQEIRETSLGVAGATVSVGAFAATPWGALLARSVGALLGAMLLVRLFKPNSWAPRWPLAIMVGVYSALKLTGETQSKLVLQIKGVMTSVIPAGVQDGQWFSGDTLELMPAFQVFANLVLVVGLVCALSHFIFTYKRGPGLRSMSRVGVVVLMITFGSMFGFTVLGRIALLIERVDQLDGFTAEQYSFGSSLLSPPVILATLMAGLLVLFALQRKEGRDG